MKKKFYYSILFFLSIGGFLSLAYTLIILQLPALLNLDAFINNAMGVLHSDFLNTVFIGITKSFDPPIFLSWFLLLLVILWLRDRRFEVLFLFFGVAGGQVIKTIIKHVVERDRPENPFELSAHASSFPSGHATTAVFFFLALAYLFTGSLSPLFKNITRTLLGSAMILLPLSRVFVQVHYFSDVVAGALLGIASFAFTVIVFSFLKFDK